MECARLNISIVEPKNPEAVSVGDVPITVMVTLGCGCPVTAGGRWDSRRFQVQAEIVDGADAGKRVVLLPVADRPSEFKGGLELRSPGRYRLSIEAYDPETGLAGRLTLELIAAT